MLVYATADDLTTWGLTPTPANAASLLRSASLLVRRATLTTRYAADTAGAPTEPVTIEAFRDATCAQVAAWAAADIDPTAGGVQLQAAPTKAKALGTARVEYDTAAAASVTAMTARTQAATQLCQEAVLILADAGLVTAATGTRG